METERCDRRLSAADHRPEAERKRHCERRCERPFLSHAITEQVAAAITRTHMSGSYICTDGVLVVCVDGCGSDAQQKDLRVFGLVVRALVGPLGRSRGAQLGDSQSTATRHDQRGTAHT